MKPVEIKTGESTNEGVAVLTGLKAGDLVVTAGANLLQPGQKVRLLDAPAPAAAPAAVAPVAPVAPAAAPAPVAPAAATAAKAGSTP